jgi:WD40 repeat protein
LIQGLAFAPDDSWVLAAATDALAGFDSTTGEELFRLPGNGSLLWAVDVAPDGDTLASGDSDGRVRVWSRSRGACLCILPHPHTVRQVRFHPGGKLLATAARDGRLRLWSIPDGRLLAEQDAHAAVVHGLAYSADGATLVSTQSDGSVRWWAGSTLADIGAGRGHAAYVADVRCLPDGRVLTAAWDGTLRLWPAQPRKRHRPLTGMMGTCAHLALHPRENWLLAASLGGEAAAWDLDSGRRRWSRQFGAGMCQGLVLHGDGVRAFVSCDDGRLFAVNAADGAVRQENRPVPGRALHDLQLRRRGDELVVALAEGDLVVVDAATLRCKRHVGDPDPTTRSLVFMLTLHPDDRLATVDIPDAPLRTFDLETGTLLWERDDIHAACSTCAPDGSALYVGDEQGFIRDLDPRTGVERRHFGKGRPFFAVHCVRVAADGRRLVSADQQIRVFDLHDGMELLSLDGDRYDPGVVLIEPARGVMVTGGGYFTDPAEVMVWPLERAARPR